MAELGENKSFPNASGTKSFCSGTGPTKYVEIGTYSVLLPFSLIGNVLVVTVFYRKQIVRTTVNCFIVNMAVADLIIPFITLPALIAERELDRVWMVDGLFGVILCKLYWLASSLSTAVSIVSMVVIAAERFHAILFAMKSPLISRKAVRRIVVSTWVFALAFRANYLYGAETVSRGGQTHCVFNEPELVKSSLIAQLGLFSVSGVLLAVFYASIIITLWRHKTACVGLAEVVKLREKENRRVTCMLVVVVVVFYSVWIPNLVNSVLFVFFNQFWSNQPCYFQWLAADSLPVLHTIITPIIYCLFNDKYRKAFRDLLCYSQENAANEQTLMTDTKDIQAV